VATPNAGLFAEFRRYEPLIRDPRATLGLDPRGGPRTQTEHPPYLPGSTSPLGPRVKPEGDDLRVTAAASASGRGRRQCPRGRGARRARR
jgi:hypothetical protein